MIRKVVFVVLTLGIYLAVTSALVGWFYPLGLTVVDDGETFVGLRAEEGVAVIFVWYMSSHPQGAEKHDVRSLGPAHPSGIPGLAVWVNTLDPLMCPTRRVENRCGVPLTVSYNCDPPAEVGTFIGMERKFTVCLHLVPLLVVAIVPSIFVVRAASRRLRVRRRRRLGLCLSCGYDLRGNESGVCPECGEAV